MKFILGGAVLVSFVSFFFGWYEGYTDGYRHGSCDYAHEVVPEGAVVTYCRMHGYAPQKWSPK